jgi:hypothetical protein
MMKRILIAIVVAAGLVQTGWCLTITPGRTEIRLAPGATTKMVFTATNESSEKVQIALSKKDWFVLDANKALPVDKWLTLKGPTYFWLKPGETRLVPVKVKCPKNAQGELVGMVSFAYQGETVSMITSVISVSVYVAAIGTEKVAGTISEIAVRRYQSTLQVAVGVKSSGNVHLRPTGTMTLSDAAGKQVASIAIKQGDPAYPGRERGYFGEDSQLKLGPGHYHAKADLTYRDLTMTAADEFDVLKDGKIVMAKKAGTGAVRPAAPEGETTKS